MCEGFHKKNWAFRPKMFLIVTILLLVKLPVFMTAVDRREGREGVFETQDWEDPDKCKSCSRLYFYDSDSKKLGDVLGTNESMTLRNVPLLC